MMNKIDKLIAQLGPRDTLTLRGECRLCKSELKVTGKDLIREKSISCDDFIGRPRRPEHDWVARFEKARAVRRHDATSIEVEVFSVTANRDEEKEILLRTVLVTG